MRELTATKPEASPEVGRKLAVAGGLPPPDTAWKVHPCDAMPRGGAELRWDAVGQDDAERIRAAFKADGWEVRDA